MHQNCRVSNGLCLFWSKDFSSGEAPNIIAGRPLRMCICQSKNLTARLCAPSKIVQTDVTGHHHNISCTYFRPIRSNQEWRSVVVFKLLPSSCKRIESLRTYLRKQGWTRKTNASSRSISLHIINSKVSPCSLNLLEVLFR